MRQNFFYNKIYQWGLSIWLKGKKRDKVDKERLGLRIWDGEEIFNFEREKARSKDDI